MVFVVNLLIAIVLCTVCRRKVTKYNSVPVKEPEKTTVVPSGVQMELLTLTLHLV